MCLFSFFGLISPGSMLITISPPLQKEYLKDAKYYMAVSDS